MTVLTWRERELITGLIVLGDQLPAVVDDALAQRVGPQRWHDLADALHCLARMCRDLGGFDAPVDAGDAGSR